MTDSVHFRSRREVLRAAGAAALASLLSGCRGLFTAPLPPCVTAPPMAPGAAVLAQPSLSALTIDAHMHIFNGTDLQVDKFITLNKDLDFDPVLKDLAGSIVQDLSWSLAPTGSEENKELAELAKCPGIASMNARIEAHREKAYQNARNALMKTGAFRNSMPKATAPPGGVAAPALEEPRAPLAQAEQQHQRNLARFHDLMQAGSRAEYKKAKAIAPAAPKGFQARAETGAAAQPAASNGTVDGLLDFIIQGFQYRFVSFRDFLDTYNPPAGDGSASLTTAPAAANLTTGGQRERDRNGGARTIDLAIANLVDYDWPLAKGAHTRTLFRDQLAVMETISILSRGQVHGFVPFDPMRQVAIQAGKRPADEGMFSGRDPGLTFAEITDAVMTRGFLGIKMYPPMGFLPLGNAALDAATWKQEWLPEWMAEPVAYKTDPGPKSFGARLDEELNQLYDWAVANQVPITAHAHNSNGPSTVFEGFALSAGWKTALAAHPGLRVNFGHTGDISGSLSNNPATNGIPPDAQGLIDLLGSGAGAAGQLAHGDLSYAEGILSDEAAFTQRMEALFQSLPPMGAPNPASRLMYGSDWFFLIEEAEYQENLSDFQAMLAAIDKALPQKPAISDQVFGLNAAQWLGLHKGDAARARLEAFYTLKGLDFKTDPPSWMRKIDSI